MGRQPCCDKVGLKKGPWTSDEDKKLINFILTNGQCCWRALPKLAGLLRCGKSCRLRWTNYLRPDLKRGLLSEDEEQLVIQLHSQLGNRWSKIASKLPGRTDNEIKNHWNTHIKKKLKKMGIDPLTHKPIPPPPPPPPFLSPSPSLIHDQEQNGQEFTPISNNGSSSDQESEAINVRKEELDAENSPISILIDDFCIDEVPLIQPYEILTPSTSSPTASSASSSTSDSSYIINSPVNNIMVAEFQELLPTFDWQYEHTTQNDNVMQQELPLCAGSNERPTGQYEQTINNINSSNNNNNNNNNDLGFWDDEFISSLDLLLNDDDSDKGLLSFESDDYLTNYSRIVLDEECLKYEQLL